MMQCRALHVFAIIVQHKLLNIKFHSVDSLLVLISSYMAALCLPALLSPEGLLLKYSYTHFPLLLLPACETPSWNNFILLLLPSPNSSFLCLAFDQPKHFIPSQNHVQEYLHLHTFPPSISSPTV